jgi:hypothetical protein
MVLTRGAQKAVIVIHEGVDDMGCVVTNTTLNLCCGRLQEIEHLEAALTGR